MSRHSAASADYHRLAVPPGRRPRCSPMWRAARCRPPAAAAGGPPRERRGHRPLARARSGRGRMRSSPAAPARSSRSPLSRRSSTPLCSPIRRWRVLFSSPGSRLLRAAALAAGGRGSRRSWPAGATRALSWRSHCSPASSPRACRCTCWTPASGARSPGTCAAGSAAYRAGSGHTSAPSLWARTTVLVVLAPALTAASRTVLLAIPAGSGRAARRRARDPARTRRDGRCERARRGVESSGAAAARTHRRAAVAAVAARLGRRARWRLAAGVRGAGAGRRADRSRAAKAGSPAPDRPAPPR